jgi:hypothetical protein
MNRNCISGWLIRAVLLAVCLAACGSSGPGYSGKLEDNTTSELLGPWPKHTQVFGVGNTGRSIQDLVMTVDTHGTMAIQGARSYLQLDDTVTNVDFSKGGVYMPQHWMKPGLLRHAGSRWVWELGDLPHGYRIAVGLRTRRIKPSARRGYLLDIHWYAVTSPDQPRNTWNNVTGVYASVG